MPPELDVSPISNVWEFLAAVCSALIVAGFGLLTQRAKAMADQKAKSDKEAARAVEANVAQVPELLDTVQYLTEQLRVQADVNRSVNRKMSELEARFKRTDVYHRWLAESMPQPPFLTEEEFYAARAAGEL